MKRTFLNSAMAVIMLAATLSVPMAAQAAKPVRPGATAATSSITLNQSNVSLGDWVTFSFSVPDGVRSPRIQIMCYQNGAVVYGMAGPATDAFELGGGSSAWRTNGGEADCEAIVYEWDFKPVQTFVPYATTTFHAGSWR